MNMPKIGDTIIVRKANGFLPGDLKNSIQIVTFTEMSAAIHEEGSGSASHTGPVVRFHPSGGGSYYTSEWDIVPAIGDRVRAVGAVLGDYNGHECVITNVFPGTVAYSLRGEFKSIQKPDDTISLEFSGWEPLGEPATDPVRPSQETALIGEMRDEITRLKDQVAALEKRVIDVEHDFNHAASSLMEEADRRSWCSEYDEFVNQIEDGLRVMTMPVRERDYEVTWTTSVIVEVPMSRTYTATSEEDAIDMAKEDYYTSPETDDVLQAVQQGNWEESDDRYREYEAEEV